MSRDQPPDTLTGAIVSLVFADGNGRMGRLWQTLLLSRWRPRLAHLPVESLIHRHQAAYYAALQAGNDRSNSASFVEFMLRMIRDALQENLDPQASHQDAPQVSRQVIALLRVLDRERSRAELQAALGLADRKSFRHRYLQPALDGGWIAPTRPDQPSSPAQRYRRTRHAEQLAERADTGTGETREVGELLPTTIRRRRSGRCRKSVG